MGSSYPEGTEYTCPNCGERYIAGSKNLQCLVNHPPGDCCHYTNARVPTPHLGHYIGPCPTSAEMGLFKKE